MENQENNVIATSKTTNSNYQESVTAKTYEYGKDCKEIARR